jgi:ATP-binding protein involved in chromosome partitioning
VGTTSIKQIPTIAIASGKGGVGKSTITVNLALALASRKKRVGLLDADIFGPNIPLMLGLEGVTATVKDSKLIPVKKFNLSIISVGFISPAEKALIWRGPLANKLIQQFLSDVSWGGCDILLIDLPPGTGDVPLTIIQKGRLTGGIIVTTAQEAALADVRKMIDMFNITKTNIIGIVENMKHLECPHCQKQVDLFPHQEGRGNKILREYNILAQLPFDPQIGIRGDDGAPHYLTHPKSSTTHHYSLLADKIIQLTKS